MKVLLLQNIKKIGQKGQIVEVSDGYASSFLIPRKMAKVASEKESEQAIKYYADKKAKLHEKKESEATLFESIQGTKITIQSPSNPNGHLFGAVSKAEIAEHIRGLKAEHILLKHGIKETGEHQVDIKIGNNKGSITVEIH